MTTLAGNRSLTDMLQHTKTGAPMTGAAVPGHWVAVTPSDATDLTGCISLYVGGTGAVAVRTVGAPATTVTFSGVGAGAFIPGTFTRVMAATTATLILAGYP